MVSNHSSIKFWVKTKHKPIKLNPPQLIAILFFILVFIGALLLKLPEATVKGVSWTDAFFIATSAATVTGLTSVDPGSTFTLFGQIVILFLIQIGGLGIMTFAILVFMMLGKRIGMKQRLIMQEALNQPSIGGVIRLVRNLFLITIIVEFAAAVILALRWVPTYGWSKGIYYSIFHTIAAFNNAGFALWPDNLSKFVNDPVISIVIPVLIIVGGLGFTVFADIYYKRSFKKLSLHSKIMLLATLIINILAFLFIFIMEYHNTKTMGTLPLHGKILASFFQAISPRTAGFNTVDIGSLEPATQLFMIILMFIGAGSTSTGGGIKITTFIVIIVSVITFMRGKSESVIMRRTIRNDIILRSLAITTISIFFILLSIMLLVITEKGTFLQIFFEVVSAFGTVGLTINFTPYLTAFGKCVIIFVMLLGKIGPLTLLFTITKRQKTNIRYPEGDIFTG